MSFKPVFIFKKEWLKIMKEDTVKHGALRMPVCVYLCRWHGRQVPRTGRTWAVDPAHGRDIDSRNVPGRRND